MDFTRRIELDATYDEVTALETIVGKLTVGSNPTPSAKEPQVRDRALLGP